MSTKMTITEALAEIKLARKKITSEQEFVNRYLTRPVDKVDPLEVDGGSTEVLKRKLQSIGDLEDRIIKIRYLINESNMKTNLTIGDTTMSIAEWLYWRREVYPLTLAFFQEMFNRIHANRDRAYNPARLLAAQTEASGAQIKVHVDEVNIQDTLLTLSEVENTLDGKLSLLNARVEIEV